MLRRWDWCDVSWFGQTSSHHVGNGVVYKQLNSGVATIGWWAGPGFSSNRSTFMRRRMPPIPSARVVQLQ